MTGHAPWGSSRNKMRMLTELHCRACQQAALLKQREKRLRWDTRGPKPSSLTQGPGCGCTPEARRSTRGSPLRYRLQRSRGLLCRSKWKEQQQILFSSPQMVRALGGYYPVTAISLRRKPLTTTWVSGDLSNGPGVRSPLWMLTWVPLGWWLTRWWVPAEKALVPSPTSLYFLGVIGKSKPPGTRMTGMWKDSNQNTRISQTNYLIFTIT